MDKIELSYLAEYQYLSESFIKKYKDKLNWYLISKYQKLSEDFIERNNSYID